MTPSERLADYAARIEAAKAELAALDASPANKARRHSLHSRIRALGNYWMQVEATLPAPKS